MKKISALPSPPVLRSQVNNKPNEQGKANGDSMKIPSNVSAMFATDQEPLPEHECVSYIYDLSTSKTFLTSKKTKKWKNVAVLLTILVTLFSLVSSVLFFVLSSEVNSSATIALGMDALFAVMGAGFVLWRLYCPDGERRTIVFREKVGSLFFGGTFILSGMITLGISTYRLFISLHSEKPKLVLITIAVAIAISGILTFALYNVARKLNSPIMMAITIDTFFACVLLVGGFSAELIYMQTRPNLWFLDDAVSIVFSFFFMLCGTSLISKMVKSTKEGQSSEN